MDYMLIYTESGDPEVQFFNFSAKNSIDVIKEINSNVFGSTISEVAEELDVEEEDIDLEVLFEFYESNSEYIIDGLFYGDSIKQLY